MSRAPEPTHSDEGGAHTEEDSLALLIGVMAATAIGLAGSTAMPFLLGSLIEGLSLDAGAAGLLGSFELGAVSLVSLVIAPRVGRISRIRLALLGAAIAVVGHGASAAVEGYGWLCVARVVAGAGEGLALAAGNAAVASALNPDRLYARVAVLGGVAGAGLLLGLPWVIEPWGFRGAFAALALVCLGVAPFLRALPAAPGATLTTSGGTHRGLAVATLAALTLIALGEGAIWAFTERLGVRVGVSREALGPVLASASLLGLGGAALASWLGTRRGRTSPLAIGILGVAVSTFGLGHADQPASYVALLLIWSVSFFFTLPYLMGTAAALDSQGRWTAAAAGCMTVGVALGPGLAGSLVASRGFPALSWLVAGACLAGLLLVTPASLSLDRNSADRDDSA
jgi:predicted MFS family arabinose efflux permease